MTVKKNVWRLIEDIPRSGSFNMAADEILLENCEYKSIPVFRMYEWECPTISIGRNEVLDEMINLEVCHNLGIPVIRRTTGGQSVLHGFDMSYSYVGGFINSSYTGSVLENYRYISKGFYRFFEKLGLNPSYYEMEKIKNGIDNHVCFAIPSKYEILVEGRKIIGNAQKVLKIKSTSTSSSRVFLQHGSIPIEDKVSLISKIFPHLNAKKLSLKMHSLESIGVFPKSTINNIKKLFIKSIKEAFCLEWEHKTWSNEELELIYNSEKKFQKIK
tara:strand:+ start:310 stop:1125 length:816 start_codon:yes stop_codon:yes gene_type:complete